MMERPSRPSLVLLLLRVHLLLVAELQLTSREFALWLLLVWPPVRWEDEGPRDFPASQDEQKCDCCSSGGLVQTN